MSQSELNSKLIFFNRNYYKVVSGFGTVIYKWNDILDRKNRIINDETYNSDWNNFVFWLNDVSGYNISYIDEIPGMSQSELNSKLIFFNRNYYKVVSGFGTVIYKWNDILDRKNRIINDETYNSDWNNFVFWLNDVSGYNISYIDEIPPTEISIISESGYLKLVSQNLDSNNVQNDLYIDISNIKKHNFMLTHNLYSDLSNSEIKDISYTLDISLQNINVSILSGNNIISNKPSLIDLSYTTSDISFTTGISWFSPNVDISTNTLNNDVSFIHIARFDISNSQSNLTMRYLYGAPGSLYLDNTQDISYQSFSQSFDCNNGILGFNNRYYIKAIGGQIFKLYKEADEINEITNIELYRGVNYEFIKSTNSESLTNHPINLNSRNSPNDSERNFEESYITYGENPDSNNLFNFILKPYSENVNTRLYLHCTTSGHSVMTFGKHQNGTSIIIK